MSKGIDCATPISFSKAQQFIAMGYSFICRYLAPAGSWKRLTAKEANALTQAGFWIISVFERGAENAGKGSAKGTEDGQLAYQYAKEVGQPEGTPIYAAVDFDTTPANYDAIEAYLRAFDQQIPGYECAVYGEYEVCKAMKDRGVVKIIWQTYAWSRGKKMDETNIFQYDNGPNGNGKIINGISVDLDESNGDAGGWKVEMAIQQAPVLDANLANTAIEYIKRNYEANDELYQQRKAEGNEEAAQQCLNLMTYAKATANGLRRASGQPEE